MPSISRAADHQPDASHQPSASAGFGKPTVWAGIVLAAVVASAAFSVRSLPGLGIFSPMILAVVVGMVVANVVGAPAHARPGIAYCQRNVLRYAIVLLGFQLTATQVASIGMGGVGVVALTLAATFCFTVWLGRVLHVDRKLTELIAAGTSICGASAVVAANAVTSARDEDVAYAVAAVTMFGTIAMLGYPLAAPFLGLGQHAFGLWSGASIHEIAQVIGASFQVGPQAGEIGTIAKLARVTLLAPVVITLGILAARNRRGETAARPPMPWFVVAFVGAVAVNSVVAIPGEIKQVIVLATTFMLTVGLAAMGLQTNVSAIRSRGLRPLLLALSAFVFIACFSLTLVKLTA